MSEIVSLMAAMRGPDLATAVKLRKELMSESVRASSSELANTLRNAH
jgi:hypothetical protein